MSLIRLYAQSRGFLKDRRRRTLLLGFLHLRPTVFSYSHRPMQASLGNQFHLGQFSLPLFCPQRTSQKISLPKKSPLPRHSKPGHKRTMTPAPEREPELVLQPLTPARSKAIPTFGSAQATIRASGSHVQTTSKSNYCLHLRVQME